MIKTEQAHELFKDAARQLFTQHGHKLAGLTLLECLVAMRDVIDLAIVNGRPANDFQHTGTGNVWNQGKERHNLFKLALGITQITAEMHGSALYAAYKLPRLQRPDQEGERSRLLLDEFMAQEAKTAFNLCQEDVLAGQPCDPENWARLCAALQKHGLA